MTEPTRFYITTAIDYPNSRPHIGTAFEKIGADVQARFRRMEGFDVHFLMGNDENTIKVTTPLAAAVAVIGDARPYNVALITLDPDAAAAYAEKAGIAADPAVLAKDPGLLAEIQKGVDAGNARLSRVEQIKKFEVLPVFWMPGTDELTPTLKLRRKPIAEKYAAEIEGLYA